MSFTFEKTLSVFTPSEAETITDVSVALQRDWRRRGIIPKHEGHARFDLHDLADLLTLKMLSDAGMGLDAAKKWIPFVSAAIIMHALRCPGAIEGDEDEYKDLNGGFYAHHIASERSSVIPGGDFLVVWANGKSEIVRDADDAASKSDAEKRYGVVGFLDLSFAGAEFARRAARSLVHIEKRSSDTS